MQEALTSHIPYIFKLSQSLSIQHKIPIHGDTNSKHVVLGNPSQVEFQGKNKIKISNARVNGIGVNIGPLALY